MAEPLYFQWQNDVLCKTIYPMREPKLRDFLVYYMEIDLWKQYKDKDISMLKMEVDAYVKAQELAAGILPKVPTHQRSRVDRDQQLPRHLYRRLAQRYSR